MVASEARLDARDVEVAALKASVHQLTALVATQAQRIAECKQVRPGGGRGGEGGCSALGGHAVPTQRGSAADRRRLGRVALALGTRSGALARNRCRRSRELRPPLALLPTRRPATRPSGCATDARAGRQPPLAAACAACWARRTPLRLPCAGSRLHACMPAATCNAHGHGNNTASALPRTPPASRRGLAPAATGRCCGAHRCGGGAPAAAARHGEGAGHAGPAGGGWWHAGLTRLAAGWRGGVGGRCAAAGAFGRRLRVRGGRQAAACRHACQPPSHLDPPPPLAAIAVPAGRQHTLPAGGGGTKGAPVHRGLPHAVAAQGQRPHQLVLAATCSLTPACHPRHSCTTRTLGQCSPAALQPAAQLSACAPPPRPCCCRRPRARCPQPGRMPRTWRR